MNSGKTTLAASLIKGLVNSGLKTGAAKVMGTGTGPDTWFMKDAGASPALGMVDAGLVSTYLESPQRIRDCLGHLSAQLTHSGVDAIVLEIGGGLFQAEIRALLDAGESDNPCSKYLQQSVDAVLFAASDALGASAGIELLKHHGVPVLALGGIISGSPLACREVAETVGVPVLGINDLSSAGIDTTIRQLLDANQRRSFAHLQAI